MSETAQEFERLLVVNYQNITVGGFHDTSFAFAEIFTYLYPVSDYCSQAQIEVRQNAHTRTRVLVEHPIYILRNYITWIGTILLNLLTVSDCFAKKKLNGICTGTKLGTALNKLLDYQLY